MIRLATVFSGIGAIEHALKRMGIEHKIVFASDNGDVDIFKKKIDINFVDIRNIPTAQGNLRDLQLCDSMILKILDKICINENITYTEQNGFTRMAEINKNIRDDIERLLSRKC